MKQRSARKSWKVTFRIILLKTIQCRPALLSLLHVQQQQNAIVEEKKEDDDEMEAAARVAVT